MVEQESDDRALTPMEEAFCRAYGDPESETYANATASAEKAGYAASGAHTAAQRALQRPRVKARLKEIYAETDYTPERVMSNIAANRRKADAKGDLAVVARCDELMAKRLGLLSDRLIQATETPAREKELTAAEQKELRWYAENRFKTHTGTPPETASDARLSPQLRQHLG